MDVTEVGLIVCLTGQGDAAVLADR